MDAVVAMEGDGPNAGVLKNMGLILASADAVALDSVFAQIVDVAPLDVPMIRIASKKGLGIGEAKDIEIVGEKLDDVKDTGFVLPKTSVMFTAPGPLMWIIGKAFRSYPVINESLCTKCKVCQKACPVQTITITEGVSRIDYSKCICCYCCHELCPSKAVRFKQSILKNIYDRLAALRRNSRSKKQCQCQR